MADDRPQRLVSLDVFRGITIAGMVLVNNPGTSPVYWPLEHAEWHGLTPTDWIFPFFLFIVGVSISISLGRVERTSPKPYGRIFRRSAVIYLLGASVSILPFFQFRATDAPDILKLAIWLVFCASLLLLLLRKFLWAAILCGVGIIGIAAMYLAGFTVVGYDYGTLRIAGVLQRIAACYLVTALLFLHTNLRQQIWICVAILLAYWAAMTLIPVPGCEVTSLSDKACNLAAYLDRLILTENHIWRYGKVYDPEGILSTLPAIVTTISGVLAGKWLLAKREEGNADGFEKAAGMFFFGCLLLVLGLIWNGWFPMNKALWTSSYVLATTGLALLFLACCYWLIDLKGIRRWAWPFEVFGANALALFVFSGFFARMMNSVRVPDGSESVSLHGWAMNHIFLPIAQPIDASWMYALSFILFWLFLMWLLYRKRIYIKV
ncbi:MAG: hypothetical protein UZ17_ACD001002319 [Acidobacteria bacterium OLB17]|nr:MAG: hypothetical protein UZ17_ACD001002319 [Acidobacteria bacterium OLB17]MCZ2389774.1 DUF5009 domain-containing protein [Acidobacteriota bacterium]